jgi:hypothetical protein
VTMKVVLRLNMFLLVLVILIKAGSVVYILRLKAGLRDPSMPNLIVQSMGCGQKSLQ